MVWRFSKARILYLMVLLFQSAICRADNVPPRNCPFASNTWFLGPIRVDTPKRHLDRFSRFCIAQDYDRTTDQQTYRQTDTLLRL